MLEAGHCPSQTSGAFARHHQLKHLQRQACVNMPLAHVSESLRGRCLEAVVREIVQELSPASEVSSPPPSKCCNGRETGKSQRPCDWIQSARRVECKSAKQSWDRCSKRWRFVFGGIKQGDQTMLFDFFDDLLLALHTPRGLYIYRHNGSLGLSRKGVATKVSGCQIRLSGPAGVECWQQALDEILRKLDTSGCQRMAFVDWAQ